MLNKNRTEVFRIESITSIAKRRFGKGAVVYTTTGRKVLICESSGDATEKVTDYMRMLPPDPWVEFFVMGFRQRIGLKRIPD